MELLSTDDQTQGILLTTDTQDLSGDSQSPSEKKSDIPPKNVSGDSKNNTKLLEQTTQSDKVSSAFNMSEDVACTSQTATKDLSVWDFSNSPEAIVSLGGLFTCNTTDNVSPLSAIMAEEEHLSPSQPLANLLSETVPETHICESLVNESLKSDDCHAAVLLRSLSHKSDSSESDTPVAPLSDLYIFESETQDFILSPHLDAQEIKSPECVPLSQTTVADVQSEAHIAVGDSSEVVTRYDRDLLKEVAHHDSDKVVGPPAVNACDVTQEKVEVTVQTQRNDSPVELWQDACQYLVNSEDRNERVQSVMKDTLSSTTSDFSVPPEDAQRSGYSPSACDVIGWSFDDNKSWGPPVERWSSVDSWASALSDWAEIISTPPEDLTAAFTEIGAEIHALTQALAEVTTQIEAEQHSKSTDTLEQTLMGAQDKPLDSQNIIESSTFSEQRCMTCCLRPEDKRTEGITQLCTTEVELEKIYSCQPETQHQLMGSFEVTSSERYSEDTTVHSEIPGAAFEVVTDLVDFTYFSVKTDPGNDVVLAIVEDTDMEEKRAPEGLLNYEPSSKHKREVKDDRTWGAERDSDRSCTPPDTLKVNRQQTEVLPDLQLLNTLTPADLHVPRADSGLNVHVLPNTLADFDRACQVEPLWGSPKFIIPLAGSSLDTQASSSSNGDQEVAKWAPSDNRDSAYDLWPESDGITDFSSGSNRDISQPEQSKTDSTTDLKSEETTECYFTECKTIFEESKDLLNLAVIPTDHFTVSEEKRVAYFTLDLNDPFTPLVLKPRAKAMPHKTHKSSSEGKTRSKKDRPACHSHGVHTFKKQENIPYNAVVEQQPCTLKENQAKGQDPGLDHKDNEKVIEIGVVPQKGLSRHQSKKNKKHTGKSAAEPLAEVENEAKNDKARTDVLKDSADIKGNDQSATLHKKTDKPEAKVSPKDKQPLNTGAPNDDDDIIKKRRLSQDKFGKLISSLETKFSKADTSKGAEDKEEAGSTRRKAYSEVVKQKSTVPKSKQELPKVVQPIQAVSVSGDPQSLCLWCQFSDVVSDHTVIWRRDRAVLAEIKRSAGDESRISLTISNASQKDLGKYQCQLCSVQGTVTLDYLFTYELLSEIVIPTTQKAITTAPVEVDHEEESVNCSRLMFKVDFLTEQYFGDSQSASIVTEKIHFGEGMHRRAFRTKLQAGQIPLIVPGHSCVLKVHTAISYGTKNNEELVQKNFNLAVEECQVQNTAREYIKAYTEVAQSFDAFGQVPEIIPIYLVHRPSNDIPYATLEEELIGDFVKYSVKDGKEINLMRKDSEAGQKCCAFQHWVYYNTEGNLLVTDMQGVGMRLTDVGIATCKKGYKGFKGNCATSFIDQFKALHQCNSYCELLGLTSLQPKSKKTTTPKAKGQSGAIPKKKTLEPTAKGKS